MNTINRRAFSKRLFAASALSLVHIPTLKPQTTNPEPTVSIPDTIAGYKLTAEEKQLAAKFLSTQEKNMSALRERDLPNSLAPSFIFISSTYSGESGVKGK